MGETTRLASLWRELLYLAAEGLACCDMPLTHIIDRFETPR